MDFLDGHTRFCLVLFLFLNLFLFSGYGKVIPRPEKGKNKTVDASLEYLVVSEIKIQGNRVTKERVILKELTFGVGDSIATSFLFSESEQCRSNLLNTSLFNFVYVTYSCLPDQKVSFQIKVEERWYWWVFPLFEQTDRNVSAFLKNGDWNRVNYGVYLRRDNFRGRQEVLKFRMRVGYSTQFIVSYNSPEYRNKYGWGFWIDYNFFDHVSVDTRFDQPVYLGSIDQLIYKTFSNTLFLQKRSGLYTRNVLQLNFYSNRAADTIIQLNPAFMPGERNHVRYLELGYTLSHDTRDSKYYPKKGSLKSLSLNKAGLGIFEDGINYVWSQARWFAYNRLAGRFYTGTEWTGFWSSDRELPYFIHTGVGYREFIRGYEYYVMDGRSYFFNKNRLFFELVPTRVKHLDFIPFSKFSKIHYAVYLSAFFDGGYVKNQSASGSNKMVNTFLYGYGLGLDLVTYYDKAVSFNYAFNRYGENGFFVHLNIKI